MHKSNQIAVIVGRYQVHELHDAHQQIIEEVMFNHRQVILFLGVSPILSSTHDPLDFTARKKMIQDKYPGLTILSIPDMRSDEEWSKVLDNRIREVFPMGDVILYGGRDSFIKSYTGQFETKELAARICLSGTEIRKHVSEDIKGSKDWRAGVIYGTYNRYPTSYQTVDVAVFNEDGSEVLLARKPHEDKFRFVGGFVSPSDTSLEHAAKREFSEEAGGAEIEITGYVGSFRVDDWRYRSERDKIMTTLFKAKYIFGVLRASDDIAELRWFKVKDFNILDMVEEHRTMMVLLLSKIEAGKSHEDKLAEAKNLIKDGIESGHSKEFDAEKHLDEMKQKADSNTFLPHSSSIDVSVSVSGTDYSILASPCISETKWSSGNAGIDGVKVDMRFFGYGPGLGG